MLLLFLWSWHIEVLGVHGSISCSQAHAPAQRAREADQHLDPKSTEHNQKALIKPYTYSARNVGAMSNVSNGPQTIEKRNPPKSSP